LIASGDQGAFERLDKTTAGDKQVDLPCFGMFEMEDGKIKVWRDYFDMNTYIKGMS
jgi:limonene-1,2-epoxide hydrolase